MRVAGLERERALEVRQRLGRPPELLEAVPEQVLDRDALARGLRNALERRQRLRRLLRLELVGGEHVQRGRVARVRLDERRELADRFRDLAVVVAQDAAVEALELVHALARVGKTGVVERAGKLALDA